MIAAIVAPFAEAVRATVQPCTFLLIVPTVTAVIAARADWRALVGATSAAVVGGWAVADNRLILDGTWLQVAGVLVVALLAVLAVPALADRTRRIAAMHAAWSRAAIVAVVTLIATMWWRPCVGSELGVILNGAQDGLASQLVPMAAYMAGAVVPAAMVVAIRYAAQPPERVLGPIGWLFAAVGMVVAGSLALGRHETLVAELTRWTLE